MGLAGCRRDAAPGGRFRCRSREHWRQPFDAALEDSVSPLLIHIGFAVAGQRGDHPHPDRQKLSQIVLSRFGQDREIAAVDHVDAIGSHLADQRSKSRMQLWGSAGEIKAADALNPHHLRDQLHKESAIISSAMVRHPRDSGGSLIAAVSEVHLQVFNLPRCRDGNGSEPAVKGNTPTTGPIFSDRALIDGH